MPPIRTLIADDEPHLAQYLRAQLAELWPALELVHLARNGIEAAERIAALRPELAFLDIQMPGLNGLEVAQGIEGETRVVFVTAYDEYAIQAFEAAALDYVLKPVKTERLARTVERVQAALSQAPAEPDAALARTLSRLLAVAPRGSTAWLRHVRASQGELTHQIDVAEVLYFQADDKYTVVQTREAEYLIRMPIVELAAQLDPERFLQVHRSTLVNVDHLAGTRRDAASRLFLRIKHHLRELPVSRAYVHLFKAM
ncbi:MAG TPA: LytTR family DNA-binding domain-containing protein [Roseateles sp.]|nr:LytTR family DNA-binding domain-containing protein [Roseateles sp.]